jgi:hypothetical protein
MHAEKLKKYDKHKNVDRKDRHCRPTGQDRTKLHKQGGTKLPYI